MQTIFIWLPDDFASTSFLGIRKQINIKSMLDTTPIKQPAIK
ncbi:MULTISPECIES: hypothetical protein [unclassified Helicobacter]|nr:MULTISPECIES: hypothetical protein [unclassified Helicobacter]